MQGIQRKHPRTRTLVRSLALIGIGAATGILVGQSRAQTSPPSEHKGLDVSAVGVISEDSMIKQIGLAGHKLQLREITIAPGGQIAKHSHETRPGLVKVISGTWTEGRPGGETDVGADDAAGILEDENTVHWFWNRGDKPATAIVCDIVAAG